MARPRRPLTRRHVLEMMGAAAGLTLIGPGAVASASRSRRFSVRFMGVRGEVTLRDPGDGPADGAAAEVRDALARLETAISVYAADSEVSRLNRDGRLDAPSPALLRVLGHALGVADRTGGAFDPTVQPLWDLYAAHFRTHDSPPPRDALRRTAAVVDYRGVTRADGRVALDRPGAAVTLNGLAQGHATDTVAAILRRRGLSHHLVNVGEFAAAVDGADSEAWRVGVAAPAGGRLRLIRTVPLRGRALATSAGYATPFDDAGEHHHLFDPATGRSARHHASVSVLAPTAAEADALSTAFAAMPVSRIARHVRGRDDLGVLLTDAAGEVTALGAVV